MNSCSTSDAVELFSFRAPSEARELARTLASHAPVPARVELGLFELMMNAVEHSNLEIGPKDKRDFLERGCLVEEIARRLQMVGYRDRVATIEVLREPGVIRFRITDQGNGFDWQRFMNIDPDVPVSFDEAGRGILMAREIAFDHLEYGGRGNIVIASINCQA